MSENPEIIRAYRKLANAIVITAARDYKKVYKRYLKNGKDRRKLGIEGRKTLDTCTLFFRSEWFRCLCDYDGEKIMKQIEADCFKALGSKTKK